MKSRLLKLLDTSTPARKMLRPVVISVVITGLFMVSAGWLGSNRDVPISSEADRSIARLTSKGELIRPTIEITDPYITVNHASSPYSRVTATKLKALDQRGRDVILREDGRHEIAPGTYRHIVLGKMMTEGSIHGPPRVAFIESQIVYY